MADLKKLIDEYRELVKAIEFGERTEAVNAEWIDWNQENAETLQGLGIHTYDLFDQVYLELEHLFYPTDTLNKVVEEWHRENSVKLLEKGLYSYDEVFTAIDKLTNTYAVGTSEQLKTALTEIAAIPLMTTEVLQEIIYEASRGLNPHAIEGLTKVTINV
jgi:hypothetical protein